MVKHTQTIRRQIPDELFECVWPFCEIGAEGVNTGQMGLQKIAVRSHLLEKCLMENFIFSAVKYQDSLYNKEQQ